jgi:hypothetical protein
MPSLLLVLLVAVGAVLWTRAIRQNRRRWLARIDLPGIWAWQDEDGELELSGDVDRGRYRLRDGALEESGDWRLEGHALVLEPESGGPAAPLDLRLFKEGTIGLHGPGRERRIYVKKRGNVVPLRRPA